MKESKYRRWKSEEDKILIELFSKKTYRQLGKILGRKATKVYRRAIRLGLSDKPEEPARLAQSQSKKRLWKKHPEWKNPRHNGRWKGGKRLNNGYVLEKSWGHPMADKRDGYYQEHRKVVEKFLGTVIPAEMIVHHMDEKKENNSLKNLYLFGSNSEHMSYHTRLRYKKVGKTTKSNLWKIKRSLVKGVSLTDAVAIHSNV